MTLAYLFGSRIRGDSNKYSDKDVLILANDWDNAKSVSDIYSQKGYEVSFHNIAKAKKLISRGSLFFKHIIDEGKLVIGKPSDSENILSKWSYSKNYQDQIDLNKNLFSVLRHLPKHPASNIVAVDLIIISIRNILIRKLAMRNTFEFSWNNIFMRAINIGLLNSSDLSTLVAARHFKNLYRRGDDLYIQEKFLSRLSQILSKICDEKIIFKYIDINVFKKRLEKFSDYSYKHLRYLELSTKLYPFDDSSQELYKLKKLYKNPNYVSNCLLNNSNFSY